jgi:hypothetical protein
MSTNTGGVVYIFQNNTLNYERITYYMPTLRK